MLLAILLLAPLGTLSSPLEILSYSADQPQAHSHNMEGIPGEAVSGEFQFQAPDSEQVFHITYTADDQGFIPVGDHLPVPVQALEVPEVELPAMVSYTNEVAAARANFLQVQEELDAQHAMEDNSVEVMERRKREADPVTVPEDEMPAYPISSVSSTHHLTPLSIYPSLSHPISSLPSPIHSYRNYVPYPLQQLQPLQPVIRTQAQVLPQYTSFGNYVHYPLQQIYRNYPLHYPLQQVVRTQEKSPISSEIQEGEEERAALLL